MGNSLRRIHTPPALAEWWSGKSRGERVVVGSLAMLAAAITLWMVLWQPLARDTAGMRVERVQAAVGLLEGRRMADETVGLARAQPVALPADARADLDRVLAQHGLRGAATQVVWEEGRAHFVFDAVPYEALIGMLEAMQRDARLRVIDASLTARVEAGTVRAELTLGR